MSKDEYLLAQCRQHGIDPNSTEEVKLGKEVDKNFDCPKVTLPGIFEPPDIKSAALIHNAETKHNKASANYTHYAPGNLVCVLDIIDAVPDAIIAHLFFDHEHANQASALEMLQALEKRFATLCATDVTAIFDAPYNTGPTIDEYLPHQNDFIKELRDK